MKPRETTDCLLVRRRARLPVWAYLEEEEKEGEEGEGGERGEEEGYIEGEREEEEGEGEESQETRQ